MCAKVSYFVLKNNFETTPIDFILLVVSDFIELLLYY